MAAKKTESEKHHSFVPLKDRRTMEIVDYSYQPSKAEIDADLRPGGTLEQAAKALVRPVNISHIRKPR